MTNNIILHTIKNREKRNRGPQPRKIVKIGEKYGRLVVLQKTDSDDYGNTLYLCKCDCGNEKITRLTYLVSGRVKSCGCLHKEQSSKTGKRTIQFAIKTNFNGVGDLSGEIVSHIKRNAMVRNIEYNVTNEYIWGLFLGQNKKCALTGMEIKLGNRYKNLETTASLDRMNSSLGYVVGNVQWVHKNVNIMKRQLNNEQFIFICQSVVNYANITTKLVG